MACHRCCQGRERKAHLTTVAPCPIVGWVQLVVNVLICELPILLVGGVQQLVHLATVILCEGATAIRVFEAVRVFAQVAGYDLPTLGSMALVPILVLAVLAAVGRLQPQAQCTQACQWIQSAGLKLIKEPAM